MAPGLYEMVIDAATGSGDDAQFDVSFHERTMADISALDDGMADEAPAFAAVSRFSELGGELYELYARPFVQAVTSTKSAMALQALHPGRVSRQLFSNEKPWMAGTAAAARKVREHREAAPDDNLFRQAESLWMDAVIQGAGAWRDMRDMLVEQSFYTIWASPLMVWAGARNNFERTRKDPDQLRFLPSVQLALAHADRGGYVEALLRMMILAADAHGAVERIRLQNVDEFLTETEPFRSLGTMKLATLIHEQTLVVDFNRSVALETLPALLPTREDRVGALDALLEVAGGDLGTLDARVERQVREFYRLLGVPAPDAPVAAKLVKGKDAESFMRQ